MRRRFVAILLHQIAMFALERVNGLARRRHRLRNHHPFGGAAGQLGQRAVIDRGEAKQWRQRQDSAGMLHDRRDAQCVTRHDDGAERRYRCFAGTRSRLAECRELRRLQLLPLLGGAIKPTQADNVVRAVAIEADQSFLIGGDFTLVNGATRRGIARLTIDGELDTAFNLNLPAGSVVTSIAVQRDGAIVLGGAFSQVAGGARTNLARVSSSGVLDTGFNPAPNGRVETLFLQTNNDLLVGGAFGTIAGGNRVRVARLNGDGTLDTSFDAALSTSITRVHTVAQQADGGPCPAGDLRPPDPPG